MLFCPRGMSKKSADRHTVCVSCRGFDCDVDCRCEECLEWSEEEIIKYAKYRKSLKSRDSSSRKAAVTAPPLTTSGPSSQPPPQPAPLPAQQPAPLPAQPPAPRPAQRDDLQSQVDSLFSNFQSLSDTLTTQLRDFMLMFRQNQSSCQPRLGPDAGENPPGGTVGESRMFQGEGAPSRTPLDCSHGFQPSAAFAAPQQAPLPAPLRVPPPVRLRMLCLRLPQPRNPPRLVGFLLALLLRVRNMTRRVLSLRPASPRVSPLPVTRPLRVWLTSSIGSALPRVREAEA